MVLPDPTPMYSNPKLRVGFVVRSGPVPAWQAELLRSVLESACAEIALVIAANPQTGSRARAPYAAPRPGCIYRMFCRLEDATPDGAPDALTGRPIEDTLAAATPVHDCSPDEPRSPDLENAVRTAALDVLVALADPDLFADLAAHARCGLWFFEAGGRPLAPADGSMAGFPEVLARSPDLQGALRVRHAAGSRDVVAYETHSAVHARSHFRTRNEHLWKCSSMVSRALRICHESGPAAYLASLPPAQAGNAPPTAVNLALALAGYAAWRVKMKLDHRRYSERWVLLWCKSGVDLDPQDFQPLQPPRGRFWADPHAIEDAGDTHVFFEDASSRTGKGHIARLTRKSDGTFTSAAPVVERPYHLSYPFVFEWRGEYYMIPESAENRTVELYRCVRLPDRWEFLHNLMEGIAAYDATLVEHEGRWWIFANVAEHEGSSTWDELCIFHADSPMSTAWKPHAGNPVISDVRRARPAGRLFRDGERLVRPSQDSSTRYGHALHFNVITELSERSYRESPTTSITPGWDPTIRAVHSFSRAGPVTFVDAIWRERR
jgi:hypothetical protein